MSQQLALLHEVSLAGLVEHSIKLLRLHQPADAPYYGCFSGGKDSCVIKRLAEMAEVNVIWHYNVTTIDPPELVWFIRDQHKDVVWCRPKTPLLRRVEINGLPTRMRRWCCKEFKEIYAPVGCTQILGIRAAESVRRAAAWMSESRAHWKLKAWQLAPILRWSDNDVWRFIHAERIPYCSLYDEGFTRLGCVGCPMGRRKNMVRQFERWPGFERAWKAATKRMWEKKARGGRSNIAAKFPTWESHWDWWMQQQDGPMEEADTCQMALEMMGGGTE